MRSLRKSNKSKIIIPRGALRIVPHGVDDLGFVPEFHAMRPFKKLLFVGRFEARKGVDIVLDAIPRLLSAHPSLVVELCGDNDVRFEDGQTYLSKFLARSQGAGWLDRVLIRGMVSDLSCWRLTVHVTFSSRQAVSSCSG